MTAHPPIPDLPGQPPRYVPAADRRCWRDASHGAYCYQHAKRLTGFHEPDRNPKGAEGHQCAEYVKGRKR